MKTIEQITADIEFAINEHRAFNTTTNAAGQQYVKPLLSTTKAGKRIATLRKLIEYLKTTNPTEEIIRRDIEKTEAVINNKRREIQSHVDLLIGQNKTVKQINEAKKDFRKDSCIEDDIQRLNNLKYLLNEKPSAQKGS